VSRARQTGRSPAAGRNPRHSPRAGRNPHAGRNRRVRRSPVAASWNPVTPDWLAGGAGPANLADGDRGRRADCRDRGPRADCRDRGPRADCRDPVPAGYPAGYADPAPTRYQAECRGSARLAPPVSHRGSVRRADHTDQALRAGCTDPGLGSGRSGHAGRPDGSRARRTGNSRLHKTRSHNRPAGPAERAGQMDRAGQMEPAGDTARAGHTSAANHTDPADRGNSAAYRNLAGRRDPAGSRGRAHTPRLGDSRRVSPGGLARRSDPAPYAARRPGRPFRRDRCGAALHHRASPGGHRRGSPGPPGHGPYKLAGWPPGGALTVKRSLQ
jgi:hypothetical protein